MYCGAQQRVSRDRQFAESDHGLHDFRFIIVGARPPVTDSLTHTRARALVITALLHARRAGGGAPADVPRLAGSRIRCHGYDTLTLTASLLWRQRLVTFAPLCPTGVRPSVGLD